MCYDNTERILCWRCKHYVVTGYKIFEILTNYAKISLQMSLNDVKNVGLQIVLNIPHCFIALCDFDIEEIKTI